MNQDIDCFVKGPSLLIELCRDVIDRIDYGPNNADTGEKEAQLREIAKVVEKLEKMGVPVPDALRAEKTRLAADLGAQSQSEQTLRHLAQEFTEIVKDLNDRIGLCSAATNSKKPSTKRSHTPKMDKSVLRKNIIKALRTLGGRARVADVIEEMGCQMKGCCPAIWSGAKAQRNMPGRTKMGALPHDPGWNVAQRLPTRLLGAR